MRFRPSVALLLTLLAPLAPAQGPSSAPGILETLADGNILLTVPSGWDSLGHRTDGMSVGYALPDRSAQLVVTVTPQTQPVPNELAPKLAATIAQAIRGEAEKGNIEMLQPPRVGKDGRFLLRMHDRFRARGKTADRLQLFRGVGRNLVSITATAFSEDQEQVKAVCEAAEQVMLSVRLAGAGRPAATQPRPPASRPATKPVAEARPAVFAEARLRVAPPPGWREQRSDRASGLIVTWRDPHDSTNLVALTLRTLPDEAKSDPKLQEIVIEQMAAGEQQSFQIEGAKVVGQTHTIADKRFLRKTRSDCEAQQIKFCITSRQVPCGQAVASVTMVALQDKADEIDALADQAALSIRPIGQ